MENLPVPSISAEEAAALDEQARTGFDQTADALTRLYRSSGWRHLRVGKGARAGMAYLSWQEYMKDRFDDSRRRYAQYIAAAEQQRLELQRVTTEPTDDGQAVEPLTPEEQEALEGMTEFQLRSLRYAGSKAQQVAAFKEAKQRADAEGTPIQQRHIEAVTVSDVRPSDVMKDIHGATVVPVHLEKVFNVGWLIQKYRNEIHDDIHRIEKLAQEPGGDFIETVTLGTYRRNVVRVIDKCQPYMICPTCRGDETATSCDTCTGRGWLTRTESIPHRKASKNGGEAENV